MSNGQKQAAGQGQFPFVFHENARNITDRNDLRDYRFWTGDFWQNMGRGFLLRFSNAIQEEQSSAAVSIIENLPFYLYRKEGETDVRWSMQVPMARKMLCIIDDNEYLVNFYHALEHSGTNNRDVYRNGNLVNRADIANFFQLPEIDNAIVDDDMMYRREHYQKGLRHEEFDVGAKLSRKSLKTQLSDTIFHNLIEYVLTDITGLDEIEHNQLRKADPVAFQELIRSRFVKRDASHYKNKLERLIDANGAQEISVLLSDLSSSLDLMIHGNQSSYHRYTQHDFNAFVDNLAVDDTIIEKIKDKTWEFNRRFTHYAQRHLMISVMTGMQQYETQVDDSRPFLGMAEERYPMYNNGVLSEHAKRRKHTAMETLNDTSYESAFTPNYLDVTE
ncbi:MAG: hypothetical protein ACRCXC_10735 [Legionella sp.]